MGVIDVLLIIVILGAAGWLLYRSIRQKSVCAGCGRCSCVADREKDKDRLVRLQ